MNGRELAIMNDLKTVLGTDAGRRVVGRILGGAYRDRPTFVPGSFEYTAFLEGQRDAGNKLANSIREINPRGLGPKLLAECEIAVALFEKEYEEEYEDE